MWKVKLPSGKEIVAKDVFGWRMKNEYQKILLKWVKGADIKEVPVENALDGNERLIKTIGNVKNVDDLTVDDWDFIIDYAKSLPWFPWWDEDSWKGDAAKED